MSLADDESLRIGCVKYFNARPLIHGWPGVVDFDHPASLCQKLAEGQLDAALVSSFEFLRNPIYRIVDGAAVGSDGPVWSVFVAHTGSLEEIEEIALDPASRTSVNLLRCLLADKNLNPRFVPPPTDEKELSTARRARLFIGDQAIRFREKHGGDFAFWDLGEAWQAGTGLPFVFALWLIRPEVKNAHEIADRLRALCKTNLAILDQLAAAQTEFAQEFAAHYFRDFLRFGFADSEKQGLLRFCSECEKLGILQPDAAELRLV